MDSQGVFKENLLKMQGYTKGYYLKGNMSRNIAHNKSGS